MSQPNSENRTSSPVHIASAVVGDAWSVLIMREVLLLGARRFNALRDALKVNRATLSDRLNKLLEAGLLERQTSAPGRDRFIYVPTASAKDYVPVLLTMLTWGQRWEVGQEEGSLLEVRHLSCGTRLSTVLSCNTCNGVVHPRAVEAERPAQTPRSSRSRSRHRSPKLDQLERGRPCPIARCLASIGDRWSVLIVQHAFFGVHEFDVFQRQLGIASNILSNRLARLCEHGVLERRLAPGSSKRRIYYLTEKGLDLYPMPAMLRQWAITTLGVADPLTLRHRWCDADLEVSLRCTHCGEAVSAASISARLPGDDSSIQEG